MFKPYFLFRKYNTSLCPELLLILNIENKNDSYISGRVLEITGHDYRDFNFDNICIEDINSISKYCENYDISNLSCFDCLKFISSFNIKWDACSHFYFNGEDYFEGDEDSYYHICGTHSYIDFVTALYFPYKVMHLHADELVNNGVFKINYFAKDAESVYSDWLNNSLFKNTVIIGIDNYKCQNSLMEMMTAGGGIKSSEGNIHKEKLRDIEEYIKDFKYRPKKCSMDTDRMIMELRRVEKKHKNDFPSTGKVVISDMCHDIINKLEDLRCIEKFISDYKIMGGINEKS